MTKKARAELCARARRQMCLYCKRPKRGGRRQGSALCEECYQGVNNPE